jgi:hypothetical protein
MALISGDLFSLAKKASVTAISLAFSGYFPSKAGVPAKVIRKVKKDAEKGEI